MQFLEQHATPNAQSVRGKRKYSKETAVMIAIRGSRIEHVTMDTVSAHTNFKLRRGKDEWWGDLKALAETMGGRTGMVAA